MKGIFAAIALTMTPALASDEAARSVATSIRNDADAALDALAAGDFAAAALHFEAAREASSQLSLQDVARRVSAAAPAFQSEEPRFALATSSTLQFDKFLKDRKAVETRFKNAEGKIVTVRIFAHEGDMREFLAIVDNPAAIRQAALEKAAMPGGPALKRKRADGGLSVLMMSEKDHALIEVEGGSEADVMAVVDAMEAKAR